MKAKPQFIPSILLIFIFSAFHAKDKFENFPILKGPYLGQKPPGMNSQPFAADIFDSKYKGFHSSVFFSPDGKMAYWQTILDDENGLQGIFESKCKNGIWTKPQAAFFSIFTVKGMDDAPFISPDNSRFFFLSCRPIKKGDKSGKYNIWVMEQTRDGWSNPQPLPPVVNALKGIHWQLSVDKKGNLYFGTWKQSKDGKHTGDIYCSRYKDGQYSEPEKLGPEINIPGYYNRSLFIAPDGSYLLFNSQDASRMTTLLICFREESGTWTKPKDIGAIIGRDGGCPLVTMDGKYLFFLDDFKGKIRPYWIEAGFIEDLKQEELK